MDDEELLALEISEDRRLRRLGIDPDDHPFVIRQKLVERLAAIEQILVEPGPPASDEDEPQQLP